MVSAAGPLLKFERNSQRVKEGTLLAFHLDAIGLFFSDFFVEVELVPGTAGELRVRPEQGGMGVGFYLGGGGGSWVCSPLNQKGSPKI